MAVSPASDGSVGDSSTSGDPRSTKRTGTGAARVAFAVLLVSVILGCIASLLYLVTTRGDDDASIKDRFSQVFADPEDDQAQREEVMGAAQQFVLRISTYGPQFLNAENRMPRYTALVKELLTTKFAAGFEQSVTVAEQTVAKAGVGSEAKIYVVGVTSMDADSADVLIGGTKTISYPNPRDPEKKRFSYAAQPFRYQVNLLKVEGKWLADNYSTITDLALNGEGVDPGAVPTDPLATAPPTTAPDTTAPPAKSPKPRRKAKP